MATKGLNIHSLQRMLNAIGLIGVRIINGLVQPYKLYEQDGLLLIYDVSSGLSSSSWKSIKLKGVADSEQTITAHGSVSIVDGYPTFDGTNYFEIIGDAPESNNVVEVCFKMTNNSTGRIVLYNEGFYATAGCALIDYANGKYLYTSVRDSGGTAYGRQISVTLNEMTTIANSAYKNGSDITSNWTSGSNSGDPNHYVGYNLKGVIYSVRVYDSDKYTAAVAAKNYAVDQRRFGTRQFTLDLSLLDSNDYLG